MNMKVALVPIFSLLTTICSASVVITEVNSNAQGGDFFELYNSGNTSVGLNGWSYDDDSVTPGIAQQVFGNITLAPQEVLLVVTGGNSDFLSNWGLAASTNIVLFTNGPGLGQNDAIVVFDSTNSVVASLNYGTATLNVPPAPSIPSMTLTSGAPALGGHAGLSAGGPAAIVSAVWDGLSTSSPTYTFAQVDRLGGFVQASGGGGVGSPGVAVPEPSSLVFLLALGTSLHLRRRRRYAI